jgi:hypothetical protein
VDCYLSYFRQQLITYLLLALLPIQSLFTESSHGRSVPCPSPFSSVLIAPHPLCCVLVFSSFFIVQVFLFVFVWWEGQFVQGAILVYPRGGCGNTT